MRLETLSKTLKVLAPIRSTVSDPKMMSFPDRHEDQKTSKPRCPAGKVEVITRTLQCRVNKRHTGIRIPHRGRRWVTGTAPQRQKKMRRN